MYTIIYDFGTSSVKTCLFEIDSEIKLVTSSRADYNLYISDNGAAEQDTEEWWDAICSSTKDLFKSTDVKPEQIEGIAFCSQMQGVVLVDENGNEFTDIDYIPTFSINGLKERLTDLDKTKVEIIKSDDDNYTITNVSNNTLVISNQSQNSTIG